MHTVSGDDARLIKEIREIAGILVGHEHDIAALATIAPIRPAPIDIFLPTKRDAAVPAIPCFYADFYFIDEHKGSIAAKAGRGKPQSD